MLLFFEWSLVIYFFCLLLKWLCCEDNMEIWQISSNMFNRLYVQPFLRNSRCRTICKQRLPKTAESILPISAETKTSDFRWCNVTAYNHPATETGSWLDRRILENRQLFIDCVSSSEKVIAVLSGHNHYATKERIGNCLYCTAPSVSTSFDKDLAPFEEAFQPGFNILTIESGRCDVETIRI